MNLYKFLTFSFFVFASCPVWAQNKEYQLHGTVNIPTLKKLYFIVGNFQSAPTAKAVEIPVKDGKFTFKGTLAEPVPAFLSSTETIQPNTEQVLQFVLDAGKITIQIEEKISGGIVSGSKANTDFKQFNDGQVRFSENFTRLNTEAQADAQKGMPQDSLQAKYAPLFKSAQTALGKFQETFIRQNPQAYISLLLVAEYGRLTENYIKADSLFSGLDAALRSGKSAVSIRNHIAKQKKTSIGAFAPDFNLSDSTGKKIPLSSLKGKYVLLDFWASWCGPCRQENPNVVQAFKTYKDKGFTVFGVSLDRDRKSWLKAVNSDGLTWGHVSDLKYWASEAAVLYGINAIPRNFLLDPQGKIIAKDLRGPALIEKLNEIFNK